MLEANSTYPSTFIVFFAPNKRLCPMGKLNIVVATCFVTGILLPKINILRLRREVYTCTVRLPLTKKVSINS